jgi:hypothetical protein
MAAIYSWPEENVVILTTTLYPVEVMESISFSARAGAGLMQEIQTDYFTHTHNVQDGSYTQLRWFYTDGPYDDYFTHGNDVQNGSYTQLRWFLVDGPYYDYFTHSNSVQNGTLINKLVEADSPDEEIAMNAYASTASTMDAI